MLLACASEPATVASMMRPRSVAVSCASSISFSAEPSAFRPEISSSAYQGYLVANGSRLLYGFSIEAGQQVLLNGRVAVVLRAEATA